jgi:hypothetical protein
MAANCGWCWARPGQRCKTRLTGKAARRMHRMRIARARRKGLLGGGGRAWLATKGFPRADR